MGKVKKGTLVLAVAMAGFIAGMATGCSNELTSRAESLNDRLTTVAVQMGDEIKDFRLTGADVDKAGFEYNVSFNGIASLEDESNAFASINYTVPHSVFVDLDKKSSINEVYDVFDYIVDKLKADDVTLAKVSDVARFNDAIVKNTPSPFEKYRVERGYVYNLSDPVFDDSTRTVSFDVKTLVELKKRSVRPGFGLGIGFVGGFGIGVGLFRNVQEGTFMTMDTYSFNFSEEDYAQIKEDPNFIYDVCMDAIERKDSSFMKATRVYTNDVTYDNADLLNEIDFNSAVQDLER